ncbi:sulfite exporter TauE/SafE family protein [Roseomonas marmotae]|uniref:Probable membrane transporter protein n=1 Tax=Roseomonas marmotae TaxID=2768161 RepID=A0ABS3K991_9PROT|nr:sulfite exporter TauE/SafE family protein [Roseomonas marmotae]MBO1074038.1 sulfite exporter TauE/SafE family protein [Roseomonas marmotae]QTI78824.1 sulfite exporter TauE/SafE family protein [Roseomonas marmotae]
MADSLLREVLELLLSWQFAVAACATVVAGLMRGYSGFGTAILLAPTYSTLWGPRVGVPVVLLMELFVSAQLLPRALSEANKKLILPICAAAVVVMPLGSVVLLYADADLLRKGIGILVLVFGLLMTSGWRYHGTRPLPLNLAVGVVSGLLKGASGMSGPPIILYLLAGQEGARQHRANLILYFGVIGVASIIPPLWGGIIDLRTVLMAAVLLPIMLICVPQGARLFHVIPLRWYSRFALILLLATGAFALLG